MATFNLDFLKRKADGEKLKPSEERTIKTWMLVAFLTVTVFLLCLNVSGAWIASHGNLFYTGSIAGAEMFVALGLGALVFTRNRLRMAVGAGVFAVAVWITLENGKMAVTHAMSDIFTGTPDELRKLAKLADDRAVELDKDVSEAKTTTTTNITAVRAEIAELRNEQRILGSADIYGIQRILQANGYYDKATLDGIRGVETERGILLRGEEIRLRLGVLAEMEKMATAPPPVAPIQPEAAEDPLTGPPVTPAEAKRQEAIELNKQAKTVEERTVWLNILLIGLESIRSAAFWAFLMDSLRSAWLRRKAAEDDLAQAEVDVEVAALRAKIDALRAGIQPAAPVAPAAAQAPESPPEPISAPPVSKPVAAAPAQPEPEATLQPPPVTQEPPVDEIPPPEAVQPEAAPDLAAEAEIINEPVIEPEPEMTAAQRRSKKGGDANAFYKRAEKLKIPLPEHFPEDVEQEQAA